MSLKSDDKIARQRLIVLELAEVLGNVSEACRRQGISRSQFDEYQQRFEEYGLEGLSTSTENVRKSSDQDVPCSPVNDVPPIWRRAS